MTTNGTNLFMTEDGISVQRSNMTKEELQENITKIMDWIRGPGNKLLISQTRLPLSFEEADEIRKAHEQFEFKCMQALAMYARLRDPRELDFTTADGLDQMEQSVKMFMQNLQHRRNVVVTCYTFFRLVMELRELMSSTDQLAEMLEAAHDIDSAERCLARLNTTLKTLESKYGLLTRECERVRHLIDQIQVMQEVERSMEELREHLTATTEWLKLRALETKKSLQVLTCERDARQANAWLAEMGNRLVETYHRDCVGKTPVESRERLEGHRRLETKAAEAHDYCKQLAHALVLMYRAAGRGLEGVDDFTAETNHLWQRLTHLMRETSERLEVADSFYHNVDILLSRVEQLLILISRDLDAGAPLKQVRTKYGRGRDELLGEFEETKNMGIALMERIAISMETNTPMENVESVERTNGIIKMKLYTLWLKIRNFMLLLGQKMEITAWIERWEVIKIQFDRLYELMLRQEENWRLTERLPKTVPEAEEALAEHRRAWNDVNRLADQVMRDLEPLIGPQAEGARPEDAAVRETARSEVERLRARKGQWDEQWRGQKERLDRRHELLMRLNDLEKEVDLRLDLLDKCKDRSLGEERPVREADSQVSHWLQDLPDLRRRINEFFGEVRAAVGDDFRPATERLRAKWERYEHDMDLFRWLVEVAIEVLDYFDRVRGALKRFKARLPQCTAASEIDAMLQELAALIAEGRQLVNADQVLDASRKLYRSEEPVQPLLERLSAVIVEIGSEVEAVKHYKDSLGTEDVVRMTRTHAVHAAAPGPAARPSVELEVNEAKNGGDLELLVHCHNLGRRPAVSWFKNGRPWEARAPWRETWDDSTLRVWRSSVGPADAGRYACVVEDSAGRRAEAAAEVRVLQPPAFTRHLDPAVDVQEGDPLLLQCQVAGEPEPVCEWYHDGQLVSARRDDVLIDNGDGVCAVKIPRVMPRHAGRYECLARSRAGDAVVSTVVKVQERTPNRHETRPSNGIRPNAGDGESGDQEDSESVASRVTLDSDAEEQKSVSEIVESFNREKLHSQPSNAEGQSVPESEPQRSSPPVRRDIFAPISKPAQRPVDDIPDQQKRPWAFHRDYYQSVAPRRPENVGWPDLPTGIEPYDEDDRPDEFPPPPPPEPPSTFENKHNVADRMPEHQPDITRSNKPENKVSDLVASFEGKEMPETAPSQNVWRPSPASEDSLDDERPPTLTSVWRPQRLSEDSLEDKAPDSERDPSPYSEEADEPFIQPQKVARPTLSEQLGSNEEYVEKDTLRLSVGYDGSPTPQVTWQKDGLVINENRRTNIRSTATRSTLTIDNLQPSDAGLYSVVVKNDMGSERSSTQVNIKSPGYAPTLIRQSSQEQAVREGESATLEFIVSAEPAVEVTWYKSGRVIRPGDDFKYVNPEPGLHQLLIRQAYLEDSGRYRAVAENPHGSKEVQFNFLVEHVEESLSPDTASGLRAGAPAAFDKSMSDGVPTPCAPTIRDPMDDFQTCAVGDRVFLRCRLKGQPPPLVSWYKDDQQIDTNADHQKSSTSRLQISSFDEEYRLVIPEAKPSDSGVYKLVATNVMGTVENVCELDIVGNESDQMRTTLIFHNTVVKSPPEFSQLFRDEVCKIGDTVVLQCQITGLPAPTVWWSYNGEMLDESRCQFENHGERYSLIIPNVKAEDSGRYSITAENSSGVATCSSLVIVEEHGKTGAIERSSYSRSSSRPLSPLLSMPLPSHSQLSQLAPSVQIERVRTVEVFPGTATRSHGDYEPATRLLVERSENSGPLSPGSIIVASQSSQQEAAPSPSDFTLEPASRTSSRRREVVDGGTPSPSPSQRPAEKRITIVREYEQSPSSGPGSSDQSSPTHNVGRRQFGRPKPNSGSTVRIVREYDNDRGSRQSTVITTTGPSAAASAAQAPGGRFSLVESSEYDSD